MRLKAWQQLELVGMFLVLAALGVEAFLASDVDRNLRAADNMILERRLSHIYYAATNPGTERQPAWDDIEESVSGPKGGHSGWEEVNDVLRPWAGALFVLGAMLSLAGKYVEYRTARS